MRPLISVIVPVYNVEDYLNRCIQSILSQTYLEIEVILVDDGSTDHSGQICDYYEKLDGRVRTIHQENRGSAVARNNALSQVRGEYISFIDSDDFWDTDMLAYLYELLDTHGCDCSCCAVRYIAFPVANDTVGVDDDYEIYTGIEAAKYILLGECGFAGSACHALFKKNIALDQTFRDVRCFEDLEYFFYAAVKGGRICCSYSPKYNYVYRRNNSSSAPLITKISNLDEVCGALGSFIDSEMPELKKALSKRFVSNALAILNTAALNGISSDDMDVIQDLRHRIFAEEIEVQSLSKTDKLWYFFLQKGITSFKIVCHCIYYIKRGRRILKNRRII